MRIRELIRTGRLEKGQKIVEKELCETLGISRTPLREALRVLSAEGLIDLVPHKGAYVSQPSMEEIRDMFEVMGVLEGTCARIAAEKMTEEEFRRLEALHAELERHYESRDPEGYIRANNAYHVRVQELTGNRVLNEIVNGLREKVLLYRYRQLYRPDRFDQSIREHRELLEAFRRRDPARAEAVMQHHLRKQCEALVSVYGARPSKPRDPPAAPGE